MVDFILKHAMVISLGTWAVLFPAYLAVEKFLGYKGPKVFTTTEYKKKFKRHRDLFNEQTRNKKIF